jgi:hypothetical protein
LEQLLAVVSQRAGGETNAYRRLHWDYTARAVAWRARTHCIRLPTDQTKIYGLRSEHAINRLSRAQPSAVTHVSQVLRGLSNAERTAEHEPIGPTHVSLCGPRGTCVPIRVVVAHLSYHLVVR